MHAATTQPTASPDPSAASGSQVAPRRFRATPGEALSADAVTSFKEDGFLILEDVVGAAHLTELRQECTAICRGDRGSYDGWQGPHDGQADAEVLQQYLCVHFPHKISATAKAVLGLPTIAQALTGVIGPDVKCVQSMMFIKAAGKPGQAWHQDEDFIPTRDRSLCGVWIAMDDATVDNGCLWVIPGSHRPGVLYPQARQNDPRFDCANVSTRFPYSDDDAVPVEVPAGGAVLFNGYLLHRSLPNRRATGFRRTLVGHYMSASSLLPWTHDLSKHPTFLDEDHSVAKADHRDIFMVAGEDPYAWMGTTDVFQPHVRPSGEGGCVKTATPDEVPA